MRLIDANLLLQWVEKAEAYNMGRIGCGKKPKGLTPEGVRHMVDTMPTVDVVEVKHGRWMQGYPISCSLCGGAAATEYEDANRYEAWLSPYCPNCGAKMDGDGNG